MTSAAAWPDVATRSGFFRKFPLLLWFGAASFLPASMTPKLMVSDIPIGGLDALLLVLVLGYFGVYIFSADRSDLAPQWHRNLPWWFMAVLLYAAASLLWAGLDTSNTLAMFYTLCLAGAAFLLPACVIASVAVEDVRSLARALSLGLAAVGAAYALESFFSLGLRSELGQFYNMSFGVERLRGPLFQPSTGHIVLLPACAFLAQELVVGRGSRLVNWAALFALAVSIMLLGSRAAVLLVGLFGIGLFGVLRRRFLAAVGLVGLVALAAIAVFVYTGAERLQSFADPRRSATYTTAAAVIAERDLAVTVQGTGYGSFWPWYLPDIELADVIARGGDMRTSEFGMTLYQPHSVMLVLAVELGLVGALFLIKLWSTLARSLARALESDNAIFTLGVTVASLSMFGDLIIFKNPKISTIWWYYLLAVLATGRPR